MKTVKTSEELGKAIKDNEDYIYVEGDLKNKIVRIKVTGKVAWTIAVGALATAVGFYFLTPVVVTSTAGTGAAISFTGSATSAAVVATILGVPATHVAITIAIAAGGVGAVSQLRDDYKIVRKDENGIILKRK